MPSRINTKNGALSFSRLVTTTLMGISCNTKKPNCNASEENPVKRNLTITIPQFLHKGCTSPEQLAAIPWRDGAPNTEHLLASAPIGPDHAARD